MSTIDTTSVARPSRPDSPWLRRFGARGHVSAHLVCFPHAGGTATVFAPLGAALPEDVELFAVQYPGRQERRGEPVAEDVSAMAIAVAKEIVHLTDRPLFLLGHSMGALVAFEVTRLIERRAHVTGCSSPPPARLRGIGRIPT